MIWVAAADRRHGSGMPDMAPVSGHRPDPPDPPSSASEFTLVTLIAGAGGRGGHGSCRAAAAVRRGHGELLRGAGSDGGPPRLERRPDPGARRTLRLHRA